MKRREAPPTFKVGQLVCFQLPEKKEDWKQYWNIGIIVSLPIRKDNETQVIEVQPYTIPESFRSYEPREEWACLDRLQVNPTRERFILDWLNAQTRVEPKKSARTILVPVTDLCPATYHRFLRALTEGKTLSLNGKESFW